jgi:hypothetical protein
METQQEGRGGWERKQTLHRERERERETLSMNISERQGKKENGEYIQKH